MSSYNQYTQLPLRKYLADAKSETVTLAIKALPRLATVLHDSEGELCVTFLVRPGERGNSLLLDLHIEGEIGMTCQRCLDLYRAPFSSSQTLLVERVRNEAPMNEDEPFERVSADHSWQLNLMDVVADEVILSADMRHPTHCPDERLVTKYLVDSSQNTTCSSIGR
jgi:uncharacterized metal-binding protein YceD (DUF177 family)